MLKYLLVHPMAVNETAAKFAAYAVSMVNTSMATSQMLTNRNVVSEIRYPNTTRTLNENSDRNTLFRRTVAKATTM